MQSITQSQMDKRHSNHSKKEKNHQYHQEREKNQENPKSVKGMIRVLLVVIIGVVVAGVAIVREHNERKNEQIQWKKGIGNKPTLLLAMVRDEQDQIVHMLQHASSFTTHVLLCDTGSRDKTIEEATHFLQNTSATFDIHVMEWIDFATSRNQCLEVAKSNFVNRYQIEWILLLDADHKVMGVGEQEPQAQVNYIEIREPGDVQNELPYLIHSTALYECAYVCKSHETLVCNNGTSVGRYEDVLIHHQNRGKTRFALMRDMTLFQNALANMTGDRCPIDRYYFYMGLTSVNLGNYQESIDWFVKTINTSTWIQQSWYATYSIARARYLQQPQTLTLEQLERLFLQARFAPGGVYRREPLYYLARLHREAGNWSACLLYSTAGIFAPPIPFEESPLFVEKTLGGWALAEEHALCLYYSGYPVEARHWFRRILHFHPNLDSTDLERIQKSITFTE